MMSQVREGGEFKQMLSGRRLVDYLVLEDPGKVVRDEDGIEASAKCRVYVGAWAVADHPGIAAFATMVGGNGDIGFAMLFRQHLNGGEMWRKSGAV